jgi:hypothetical protein
MLRMPSILFRGYHRYRAGEDTQQRPLEPASGSCRTLHPGAVGLAKAAGEGRSRMLAGEVGFAEGVL